MHSTAPRRLPQLFLHSTALGLGLGLAAAAQAQDQAHALYADSPSVYAQWGGGREDRRALVVGATLPWQDWQKNWGSGVLRGHWDVFLGQWSTNPLVTPQHSTVLGAGAALRWWPQQGQAPWFVEAGTGVIYIQPQFMGMSTRLNFASHLGLGFQHGARRQHEWQLRLQHSSNASIKKPNPGQNFVQLRYALHF